MSGNINRNLVYLESSFGPLHPPFPQEFNLRLLKSIIVDDWPADPMSPNVQVLPTKNINEYYLPLHKHGLHNIKQHRIMSRWNMRMLIQHTKRKERKEAPKQMVATPPSTKSKRLTPMRKCNHIGPLIHLLMTGIAVEELNIRESIVSTFFKTG